MTARDYASSSTVNRYVDLGTTHLVVLPFVESYRYALGSIMKSRRATEIPS